MATSKANERDPEMKGKASDRKRGQPFELRHNGLPSLSSEATSATAARHAIEALGWQAAKGKHRFESTDSKQKSS